MCMTALSMYHAGISEVVITGERGEPGFEALRAAMNVRYEPAAVVIPVTTDTRERLGSLLPWVNALITGDGRATAFVCRDFACLMPAHSPEELAERFVRPDAVPR